ncbi:MAG: hypothetical protein LBT98_03275 [Puniceicoccales bacterium]|nr:hypothetical protein [Puniceicoccales bacterium]
MPDNPRGKILRHKPDAEAGKLLNFPVEENPCQSSSLAQFDRVELNEKNVLKSETQNISVEKIVIPPCKLQTCKTTGICPVLFTTCLTISLLALAGAAVMVIFLPFPLVFLAVPLAALAIGSIGVLILCTCLRKGHSTHTKLIPTPPSQENNQTTDTSQPSVPIATVSSQTSPMAPPKVQSLTLPEPPSELSSKFSSSTSSTTSSEISSQISSQTSSQTSHQTPPLPSPEISPAKTVIHFPASAKISTQLSETETPTEQNVKELLLGMFGNDFPVDSNGLEKIDFHAVCPTEKIPNALEKYSLKQHNVQCVTERSKIKATPLVIATSTNKSVFQKQNLFLPNTELLAFFNDGPNKSLTNEQTIWGDISQITKESYVCSHPLYLDGRYMPTQTAFCEALGEEFNGKNLIIADMSSDGIDYPLAWENTDKYSEIVLFNEENKYFNNPTPENGVITNVEHVGPLEKIPIKMVRYDDLGNQNREYSSELALGLQSFCLNKNKKKNIFYRLRIANWSDNGALAPASAQALLDAYKRIEAQVATLSGRPNEPVCLLAHCNSGAGRSPSFLIYRDIDRVASACEKLGWVCDYNDARQNEMIIDGKVNLSWVLCRIMQNGFNARAVYGYGSHQFPSYADYAEYRARTPNAGTQTQH